MNQEEPSESTPDVLPPIAIQLLAAFWILLFGGRWIGIHLLLAARILVPEQVAVLDEGLFKACYLLLLILTLIVLVLRALRAAQAHSPRLPSQSHEDTATPVSSAAKPAASSRVSARRANPRD